MKTIFVILFCSFLYRMQDQSTSCQDQYIHQDPRTWRRTRICRHRPQRRRGLCQTRNSLRCRPLFANPCLAQIQHQLDFGLWSADGQHSGSDHRASPRTLPCGRPRCGTQGCNNKAYPTADPHLYRYTFT